MASRIYADRKIIIITSFLIVGGIYLLRLLYIQVIDRSYELSANNNVLRYVTQYPARGLIYDRHGKLLVVNEAVYDLMVIPRQVKDLDTMELCRLLNIDTATFNERMRKAKIYSPLLPSAFEKQISKQNYGFLQEKLYEFSGFYVQARTLRNYPPGVAAHLLGYIGEVTPGQIEKNPYYKMGDYIGISGIERSYENDLRGIKGLKIRMVDVHNRDVGSYREGRFDTAAIMGNDLYTGLDADVQALGEKLMSGKRGSVVALDPSSGEIICFLSSPSYDPNLLVGQVRSTNFARLQADPVKPLLNRAISGQYTPGSTFKMANDLIALQEGVITDQTRFSCQGPGTQPIKCTHHHQSPLNVVTAIQQSCNPFHFQVYRQLMTNPGYPNIAARYDKWREYLMAMGFGRTLGSDLPYERKGILYSSKYFDKVYGAGRWNIMTIRSLSIGQGEIDVTPLQMANFAAIMANRGWYYTPHLVRAIGSENNKTAFTKTKNTIPVDKVHIETARRGMEEVITLGTAKIARIDSITIAGKTGTAQNPHGKDHSVFIAFAPVENPKIAICVIVENAGFGSTWAAPIASLLIEKYITRKVKRTDLEERMATSAIHYGY